MTLFWCNNKKLTRPIKKYFFLTRPILPNFVKQLWKLLWKLILNGIFSSMEVWIVKFLFVFRTLKSKRDTRPGSLGLWRRVSEQQGSLTNRESSKFQQRRRKGSCGKKHHKKPPSKSPNYLHHYNVYNTLPPIKSPQFHKQEYLCPGAEIGLCLKPTSCIFCKSKTFFFEGLPFVHYKERFDHDIALAKNC